MNKVIHKQQFICAIGTQQYLFPHDAKILSVQEQGGFICIWYMFDQENEYRKDVTRYFLIAYTGDLIVISQLRI